MDNKKKNIATESYWDRNKNKSILKRIEILEEKVKYWEDLEYTNPDKIIQKHLTND